MTQKISLKQIAPHIIAIIVFVLMTLIMYWPMFMENKTLSQNDILQGAGANQDVVEYREATGEEALWTNGMFSGMPAYLINVQWSGELTKYIRQALSLGLPSPASQTFIAMLTFYILLLVFRVNPYVAMAGGFAFGLNTFFLISIEAGHIWKVAAISYMPLVLAGIILTFRKKYLLGFTLTAVAMAMEISSNHYQVTYYLMLVVLILGIFKLIDAVRNKSLTDFAKIIGVLFLAVLLGIGANIGKIWTAYEYGKYSIRGKAELSSNTESSGGLDRDYAFAWSNGIWEPMTFLVPNFYGGATTEEVSMTSDLAEGLRKRGAGSGQIKNYVKSIPTYWGDQPFTSGPYYMGAITVFLFILGAFLVRSYVKWWLIAASIFGIILSWGDNFSTFNYFMFDYFPGYNKFRAVSMTVAIPFLCMPLLGFIGVQHLIDSDWNENKKQFLKALGVGAGLCLLLLGISFIMGFRGAVDAQLGDQAWLVELIRDQRASMFRMDTLRSLFFIIAAGAVLFYMKQGRIKKEIALLSVAVLLVADYIPVAKRYLNEENFKRDVKGAFFAPTEADEQILQDDAHYRVLNLNNPFNEARTSYYHASLGGYHGAKMRRYQDIIENHLQTEIGTAVEILRSGSTDFSELDVLNMLNTKYLKFGDQAGQVVKNEAANGNAWFTKELQKVSSPDEEISVLGEINTKNTAVINTNRFDISDTDFSDGSIELTSYSPNELLYESTNSSAGLAVFSEVYYPKGWHAFIDGKEAEILQVNYVLRALEVPAGKHEIRFEFKPTAYHTGNKIMWASSILLILLIVGSIAYSIKKRI